MNLQKAKFNILGEKNSISDTVICSFNPSEYKITNEVRYNEKTTLNESHLSFSSLGISQLSLTLYFNSVSPFELYQKDVLQELDFLDAPPVTDITQKIVKTTLINATTHKPPIVQFIWGNLNFTGVVSSVNEHYTMFTSGGKPIRAKLDIVIKEYIEDTFSKKKTPFESPDRTKWVTLTENMSFWELAHINYGDAGKWRIITEANNIDNPLKIEKGRIIQIPAL